MNTKLYGNTEREGNSVIIPSEIMAVSSARIVFIFMGSTKAEKHKPEAAEDVCESCPRPEDIYPDH